MSLKLADYPKIYGHSDDRWDLNLVQSSQAMDGYGTYQDLSTAVTSGHKKNMKNPETLVNLHGLLNSTALTLLKP